MRNVFLFTMILVLCGAFFAQAFVGTDTTVNYEQSSLSIQRNLIIKQAGYVSSNTGAALEKYESIVQLIIKNNANVAKDNAVITEDLTYIPIGSRVEFNIQPIIDGNYARWKVDKLEADQTLIIRFTTPSIISKSAFEKLNPPKIEFEKKQAILHTTESTRVGSTIQVTISDVRGVVIPNAYIQINYPDGESKVAQTDATGQLKLIAQQVGVYSFNTADYEIQNLALTTVSQTTQQEEEQTPNNNQQKPVENQSTEQINIVEMIYSNWQIIVLIIILIVAYFVYRYLSAPVETEESVIPPAPATRPAIDSERKDEIMARAQKMNENKPEDSGFTDTHNKDESENQELDTYGLIQKRRMSAHNNIDETTQDTENTQNNFSSQKQIDELLDKEEDEKDILTTEQEHTQKEIDSVDDAEIDEDAIRKTIEELEQLRKELKTKSEQHDQQINEDGQNERQEHEGSVEQKEMEFQEIGETSAMPLQSIVQSARKSQRESSMNEDITQLLKEEHEETKNAVEKKKSKNLTKKIKVKSKKVKTTKQKEVNKIKQTKKLKPKKPKSTKIISKNKKKKK